MSKIHKESTESLVNERFENEKVDSQAVVGEISMQGKTGIEDQKVKEKILIPMLDYDSMDLEKLNEKLQKLLKNYQVNQIKENVNAIKTAFNRKFEELLVQKKEDFLKSGGNIIDFYFSSPTKVVYNKLISQYKERLNKHYHQLNEQLKENLKKKNQIIEQLKALIEKANSKTMYSEFKALEARWKTIGAVPKTKYNDTWKVYHHHVERFYDLLHLDNSFRNIDFKHNLNKKQSLIDKVIALEKMDNIDQAFRELQNLHRIWKEEIGPVESKYRQEIWQKFSQATSKIHEKRHRYFKELNSHYKIIIEQKEDIITRIDNYDTTENKTHSHWQKSIKEIEDLRQKFFSAGKLPHNKGRDLWEKLKMSTKNFNRKKNEFYKEQKVIQNENLKKKRALIELAKSFEDSQDWKVATQNMVKIQEDWKKIGQVPAKFSDQLWKEFKQICNHYFDRLKDNKNRLTEEEQEFVNAKKALISQLEQSEDDTLDGLKEIISKWKNLTDENFDTSYLTIEFNKQLDKKLKRLLLSKSEIELLKFENTVYDYITFKNSKKLEQEKNFIKKKISEIGGKIQQLETNLSFISNASKDDKLLKNVHLNLKRYKEEFAIRKLKLEHLKKANLKSKAVTT